jgi:hypothetical protein
MKTLLRPITTLEKCNGVWAIAILAIFALALCLAGTALPAAAQAAGEGSIEGTVMDTTGAVVPHASVTISNVATGQNTVREATSAGFFSVSPVLPGTYTVQVSAKGFKTLVQDNVVVDALQTRTVSPVLTVGTETQTVTVTGAPPVLDTADATIGLTVENSTYSNLPIQMNGAQRDPTAFGILTPGAQTANNGGRLPIVGGTGSYLGQLYVDGMPAETVSQQGDNRLVSLTMSIEAVDQFQMVTSTPPAEYMGAGAENFTMKSGGLQYHGQASDFVRNTVFDNWGFTAPWATTKNALGQTVQAPKPIEHQNELSLSVGGVVPKTGKKLFFFVAYDKFHYRKGASYALYTIPSALMQTGNFTELNGGVGTGLTGTGSNNPAVIFDPMTTVCGATTCTRQPFQYNGTNNVIPPGDLSSIAKAMQAAGPLPAPTNSAVLTNNYLGGYPGGFDNHVIDWRVDYDMNEKHRISSIGTIGVENYLNNYAAPFLPPPYIGGDLANVYPKNYIVEDAYTFTPNVVNQLKYSFTRFFQNIHDATQGISKYEIGALGVSNVPGGQAGQEFPGAAFGATTAFGSLTEQTWTGNGNSVSTQLTTPNNYALTDNVQWLKGKHALTMGLTFQWQEINNANPATLTGVLDLAFNPYATSQYSGTTLSDSATGFAYASFLLGAVGGSTSTDATAPSIGLDYVSELAGRYKTISPYVRDSFRITPKLTLDLGVRWDYLPPFHELRNRWTYLNPTMTNPLTNSPGIWEFAGNYGGSGVSCGCKTPVPTYWGNWGPRIGFAYSFNNKTVLRAGFAQVFTQAGGVGGRGGATGGTGQTGFNISAIGPTGSIIGAGATPPYWLNSNAAYLGANANTAFLGASTTYPAAPTPGVTAQELNTGFYVNGSGKFVSASSTAYADPHYSARAPELVLWNFGLERAITSSMTAGLNYVGNESHFIINSGSTGANARGLWTNELNPSYISLLGPVLDSTGTKPLLGAQATAANIAILQKYAPNAPTPAFYTAAAALSTGTSATIQQMLVAFPQYSSVADTWGNVGNFAYNSLQLMVEQRVSHGLTFTFNYTWAKNIGDDGTYRTGFDIPASAISRSTSGATIKQDRIDRSWTVISLPQIVHVFGVYQLPFGKGQIGSDSMLVRALAGGWSISENYTYQSGAPIAVTWSGAGNTPGQGTGMPDLNTTSEAYLSHNARLNGSYGAGPNGTTACNLGIGTGCKAIQYIDVNAFTSPVNVSTAPGCVPGASSQSQGSCNVSYLIGNAPRTAPLNLRNPGTQNIDARLSRTFPLHFENTTFAFEADCLNVWNKNTFAGPGAGWSYNSTSFGAIGSASGARDWQFAGHINF